MLRENRIKEYIFSVTTPASGSNLSAIYSEFPLNGELLKVEWKTNTTGSIWMAISGTGEEFFRNNTPSGTAFSVVYPIVLGYTGSPYSVVKREINDKIYVQGQGFDGGSVSHMVVKYR